MAQDQLRQAFALMKQGNKQQATQIVRNVIKQDRNNVSAWWLFANVLDDPAKKQKALEKVLSLDSNHTRAQQMLASLENGTGAKPSSPKKTAPAKSQAAAPANAENKEIDFDWSKLEKRDAKKKETTTDDSGKAVKMATYLMMIFPFIIAIGVGLLIGIPAYRNNQTANEVSAIMTDFLNAMMAGDFETADIFVCQRFGPESEFYYARNLPRVYQDYSIDLSGLDITVDDFKSDQVMVHLAGDVSLIPTEGEQRIISIDDIMGVEGLTYETTSFRFERENDQWLVCDPSFRSE